MVLNESYMFQYNGTSKMTDNKGQLLVKPEIVLKIQLELVDKQKLKGAKPRWPWRPSVSFPIHIHPGDRCEFGLAIKSKLPLICLQQRPFQL